MVRMLSHNKTANNCHTSDYPLAQRSYGFDLLNAISHFSVVRCLTQFHRINK